MTEPDLTGRMRFSSGCVESLAPNFNSMLATDRELGRDRLQRHSLHYIHFGHIILERQSTDSVKFSLKLYFYLPGASRTKSGMS